MTAGIYIISNNIDRRIYVGQSNNCERRWRQHLEKSTIKTPMAISRFIASNRSAKFKMRIVKELPDQLPETCCAFKAARIWLNQAEIEVMQAALERGFVLFNRIEGGTHPVDCSCGKAKRLVPRLRKPKSQRRRDHHTRNRHRKAMAKLNRQRKRERKAERRRQYLDDVVKRQNNAARHRDRDVRHLERVLLNKPLKPPRLFEPEQ